MKSVTDEDIVRSFAGLDSKEPTLNAECWSGFFSLAKRYGTHPKLLLSDPDSPEIAFHDTPYGFTILNLSSCVGLLPSSLRSVEKACEKASRDLDTVIAIDTFYTLDDTRSDYARYVGSPVARLDGSDYNAYFSTLKGDSRYKIRKSRERFRYERIYSLTEQEMEEIVYINKNNSGGRTRSDYLYSTNFLLYSCAALSVYGRGKDVIAIKITDSDEVVAYMFSLRVKETMVGNAMATKRANYVGVFGLDSLIMESCKEGYLIFDPNVVNSIYDVDIERNPSTMYKRVCCNSESEFPTYYVDTRSPAARLLGDKIPLPFCSNEGWVK